MRFNSIRSKDPVLAAILSLGLVIGAPVLARAQTAQSADWEEVGPSAGRAQQQLLATPPRIAAGSSEQNAYRPPVEVPAQTAAVAGTENFYTVQAGDTLPKIALKVYGDPNKWQDLMILNNISNGNRIFVGQKLVTTAENSSALFAAALPAAAQAVTQTPIPAPVQNVSQEEVEVPEHVINETVPSVSADAGYYEQSGTYTVRRGDTLGSIAKKTLGSTQKWRDIAKANPSINPNRLNVGDVLVLPGSNIPEGYEVAAVQVEAKPLSSEPWQTAAARTAPVQDTAAYNQNNLMSAPPAYPQGAAETVETVSAPSFDQPPLMAPPPPQSYGVVPAYNQPYTQAPAAPVYSDSTMTPPPPPVTSGVPAISAPPSSPYMATPIPEPTSTMAPVAISTRELYREEKYRLPDELKTTDYSPYFVNSNGYHGLYEVESALLPYYPTWHFGVQVKYDNIAKINSVGERVDDGSSVVVPISLLYTGKKFFAGLTVPFENWEVTSDGGFKAELSGVDNPSLKAGYQVWKNLEGTHAVSVHAEGKFAAGNYHRPIFETVAQDGKTKDNTVMGVAGTSKSAEIQIGGAYSGQISDRWTTHINMAIAQIPGDDISKFILRGGIDYRVNRNFSLVGELNSTSYDFGSVDQALYTNGTSVTGMTQTDSGTNVDLLLGFNIFNESWEGMLGFPIALQNDIGYSHDFGVVFGVNHRWD